MEEDKNVSNPSHGKIIIGSFMNILKNLKQFYEVYTDKDEMESSTKDQVKKKVAEKCYEINVGYIKKQLDNIKQNIATKNTELYNEIVNEINNIVERFTL